MKQTIESNRENQPSQKLVFDKTLERVTKKINNSSY